MDDYVSKPVKRDALESALNRWLRAAIEAAAPSAAIEPTPHSSDAALDHSALEQLRQLFDGDLSEVICAYLSDAPVQIDSMANAIAQQDHAALARAAHTLRSSSRSLGAHAVAELAISIETLGRANGSFDAARPLVAQLRSAHDAIEPHLRQAGSLDAKARAG